jgi:hypothetical protein
LGEAYCDILEVSVVAFFVFAFFVFFVLAVDVVSWGVGSESKTGAASEKARAAVNSRVNNFFMRCILLKECTSDFSSS